MKKINFVPQYHNKTEPIEINGRVFTLTKLDPVEVAQDMLPKLLKLIQLLGLDANASNLENINLGSINISVADASGLRAAMGELLNDVGSKLTSNIIDDATGKNFMEVLFPQGLSLTDKIGLYMEIATLLMENGQV